MRQCVSIQSTAGSWLNSLESTESIPKITRPVRPSPRPKLSRDYVSPTMEFVMLVNFFRIDSVSQVGVTAICQIYSLRL